MEDKPIPVLTGVDAAIWDYCKYRIKKLEDLKIELGRITGMDPAIYNSDKRLIEMFLRVAEQVCTMHDLCECLKVVWIKSDVPYDFEILKRIKNAIQITLASSCTIERYKEEAV